MDTAVLDFGVGSGTCNFPGTVVATTGAGTVGGGSDVLGVGSTVGSTVGETPETFSTMRFSIPGLAVGDGSADASGSDFVKGTAGGLGSDVDDETTNSPGPGLGVLTS